MRLTLRHAVVLAVLAAAWSGIAAAGERGERSGARDSSRAPDARLLRYSAAPGAHGGTPSRRVSSASSWWGGSFLASTGETVQIMFADAYPLDANLGRSWADLFAKLVHGDELRSMRAYVAPLDWVQEICGDGTLGCYGGNQLVAMGTGASSVTPWQVAAHEYGHHVAGNRENPPWSAIDWGTKRWASYVNVCSRAAAGAVFPGNEDDRYRLNPGEGFAEAYRALNEIRGGASVFSWALVDSSFAPDAGALAAVERDVRTPWAQSASRTIVRRFTRRSSSWSTRLPTPLDGTLELILDVPSGTTHTVELLDAGAVVARGLWSGPRTQTIRHQICGTRAFTVRIRAAGAPRRFILRTAIP